VRLRRASRPWGTRCGARMFSQLLRKGQAFAVQWAILANLAMSVPARDMLRRCKDTWSLLIFRLQCRQVASVWQVGRLSKALSRSSYLPFNHEQHMCQS
jgi:hypothetical protein